METLDKIQKITKVCKTLSKIAYVTCFVAGIICAVSIICLAVIPDVFKIGGVTIRGIIEKSDDMSLSTTYSSLAVGILYCIGYRILFKYAYKYFNNELKSGTPFSIEGAKELNTLGLYTICIPIIVNFTAQVVCEIMKRTMSDIVDFSPSNYTSIILGLVIIVVGLICRYGAETTNQKEDNNEDISI